MTDHKSAIVSVCHLLKLTTSVHVNRCGLCLDVYLFFIFAGDISFWIKVCGVHDNMISVKSFGLMSGSFTSCIMSGFSKQ